ncbi:MAG: hypothetical protein HZB23_16280 [Deltaproteobacteria bacterium]|nr:hypothetical protein [Deltaproteobacteria bacterium]
MKKRTKRILFGLSLFLLMAAGGSAAFLAYLYNNPSGILPLVLERFQDETGLLLSADTFLLDKPGPHRFRLTGHRVRVADRLGMSTVLSAENLSVICDLSRLLRGVVVVETVRLSGLSAQVTVKEDGRMSLGGWVLPKKKAGRREKPSIRVADLDIAQSSLNFDLPKKWGAGRVSVANFFARATPEPGGGAFKAGGLVGRAGKTGKIAASGKKKAGAWSFHVTGENLPADGFTIPAAGKSVPAMPVFASLNLDGNLVLTDKGAVSAKALVRIRDAFAKNHKVPGGRIVMSDLSGIASLASNPDSGLVANFTVKNLALAFSRFTGLLSYKKGGHDPALFSMNINAGDFLWDDFKPWLAGFLVPSTGLFLKTNITDALCRNVKLRLDWNEKPPKGEDHVKLSVTTSAENLSMTFDNQKITKATDVSANVSLDTMGLTADILSAAGIGCKVSKGTVDIVYGLPKKTPLSFSLKGRVDTGAGWPWMRDAIGGEGFVSRLGLSGIADAEVFWSWSDIATSGTDTFLIKALTGNMSARFNQPGHPLDFKRVRGHLTVSPESVVFDGLTAFYGPVSVRLAGDVAITDQGAFSLTANLGRLESLLPAFDQPGHPLAGWRPRSLSGLCTVERKKSETSPADISASLSTRDEAGRVFSARARFSQKSWEISQLSGRVGGFSISGSAGIPKGDLLIKSAPKAGRIPYSLSLSWKNGRARSELSGPEILLDDFITPLLPRATSEVLAWIAAQPSSKKTLGPPFRQVDFSAFTPKLRLTRDMIGPARATGSIDLGETGGVIVNRLNLNGRTARLSYLDHPDRSSLSINLDKENWADLLAVARQALSPAETRRPSSRPRPFDLSIKVASLAIPGQKAEPLSARIVITRPLGRMNASGHVILGDRTISATAAETPEGLSSTVSADRMEAALAGAMLDAVKSDGKGLTARAAPLPFSRVELSVEAGRFIFSDSLASALSATFSAGFSRVRGGTKTEIAVKRLSIFDMEAKGALSLGPGMRRVNAAFSRLDLGRAKSVATAIAGLFPAGSPGAEAPPLEFSISAPRATVPGKGSMPLVLAGKLSSGRDSTDLDLMKAGLGPSRGAGRLTWGKAGWKVDAFFGFLDMEVLKAAFGLSAKKAQARPTQPVKKKTQAKPAGTRIAFPLPIPDKAVEASVKVGRLDLGRRGVISSVTVNGSSTPEKVMLSEISWKKKGEEAFRLAGVLTRRSEKLWQGEISVNFSDMGATAGVFFPLKDPKDEKFPVEGGRTHGTVKADLVPAPDGLWIPRGRLSFVSREGRINKGGPLVFVMGALSPFNYARALAGKKSELSGGVVFDKMEAAADFNGGTVTLSKFSFESPSLRYVATGDLNIETNRQNLSVCVQPFSIVNRIIAFTPGLNFLLQNKDGAIIQSCFTVTGDMADPKVTPVPQSMIPTRLGDLFNR